MSTDYGMLNAMMKGFAEDSPHWISTLSNASALLWDQLADINWAGFYLMEEGRLILGPFQGKVACVEIAIGKGVCGTAVQEKKIQRIENVHEFPGHIACDCASNSEIVLPIYKGNEIFGVLDIDSPSLNRFSPEDEKGLEEFAQIITASIG